MFQTVSQIFNNKKAEEIPLSSLVEGLKSQGVANRLGLIREMKCQGLLKILPGYSGTAKPQTTVRLVVKP